jgi:uridine phosphorylase
MRMRPEEDIPMLQRTVSSYLITPQQTLAAARKAGLDEKQLGLSGLAVLTFSRAVVERLETLCALQDAAWISPSHHPYAAPHVFKRGMFQGIEVVALVPPMGASPLACILEDLAVCGVCAVLLACAAWSLGPPVRFGDLIVPAFSVGPDGTSIYYGNDRERISAEKAVVDALEAACRGQGIRVHVGGNASCEALYRITPQMAEQFRREGCLCVDNGEASTLFAVSRALGVLGGVLFQPYIELAQGWDPARLDERYRDACHVQAEIVLESAVELNRRDLLRAAQR